ncbi:Uncharacterised protein [Candidatus Bartonella washoeensis]|uniref:Phage related protein n=1 Tax=Candidatus Bartonella washoeensis Sb944nv TaxID=1094563 RepID=J1IZ96_9HYPH|nr:hypothetical protein [Bartonella washoeensis]EJF77032.1 hypothetical protein MCQ_01536 [Bartonella washoeensis Sb944nv]SPU27747.1 Uncharacterised protein [Bartonella washoeensis]
MEKKYEFTDEKIEVDGRTLYRIRALRDFGDVNAGDLGGFIDHEGKLSHKGNCWVGDLAAVYENTQVYDDANIFGAAHVYGDACIYGSARVYNNAEIYDKARICGNAQIYKHAFVGGNHIMSTGEKTR